MMYKFILATVFSFLISFGAQAQNEYISGKIVQEGDVFGIELKMKKGWHTYHKEPGEAGIPTEFDWKGSSGIEVEEVIYPEAEEYIDSGIRTNVYHDEVFFPVNAKISDGANAVVKVTGAVCADICIPYTLDLESKLNASGASGGVGLSILLTAFLAGLILNIMPCVLPVLSLKVLSVVKQAGKQRAHASLNFAVTAAGIISSFLVLALIAVSLKQAGMQIGWGLHFQSPYFVGALMLITLLFAVSLFGLFHLRPPSWLAGNGENKDSLLGNFISGVLATVLGTACTAPVVVTAVGFALSGSAFEIVMIFLMMGVGMALPFLIFAVRPGLAGFLPKPGRWMEKVKAFMGILLLGTAVWLGSVLYSQLAGGDISKGWQQFDETQIETLVDEGRVVFVDITAEWCVNCKANKLAVSDTEEMHKFYAENEVVLMQGDMTKPSKTLLEYIKSFKRYGIPVNVVYGPNAKEGIVLETILTKDAVKEAIYKAAGK